MCECPTNECVAEMSEFELELESQSSQFTSGLTLHESRRCSHESRNTISKFKLYHL